MSSPGITSYHTGDFETGDNDPYFGDSTLQNAERTVQNDSYLTFSDASSPSLLVPSASGNPNSFQSLSNVASSSSSTFGPSSVRGSESSGINSRGINSSLPTSSIPTGSQIDWNGIFQTILDRSDDTKEKRLVKHEDISELNNNFVAMAKQLGKIIIAEAFLAPECQTIRPFPVGGIAGGKKYKYNGILFKLQTDWQRIYGSNHNAMKSGSLELKGLMRYYGFNNIHVPLMAIIDYRGFRLVAESVLPINNDTLHYGSADGGKNVKDGSSHPSLQQVMKTVGTTLNIAGHYCGLDEKKTYLYGPVDIEAHVGTDGRNYVIDFARVFPPTAEEDVSKTFLYQVFRPEFVRKWKEPLSSDAFAKFSKGAQDMEEHNERVRKATRHLLEKTVPDFAAWLEANRNAILTEHPLSDLTELAHREGINVRYLGIVRHHLKDELLRNIVLMELIARVIKNTLNQDLREACQNQPNGGEYNYFPIALKYFNIILGLKQTSEDWWRRDLKRQLTETFKLECLNEIESQYHYSLRGAVDLSLLFRRVQQLTGVKLTKKVMKQLKTMRSFELVSPDIKKMGVRVKHMNITSQAEGSALAIQAMSRMLDRIEGMKCKRNIRGSGNASALPASNFQYNPSLMSSRSYSTSSSFFNPPPSPTAYFDAEGNSGYDRLFNLAMSKYEQAIRATPDNSSLLTHYAGVLIKVGLLKTQMNEPSATYFEKALSKLSIAGNSTALLQLGELLQYLNAYWSETDMIYQLSSRCFEAVVSKDPQNAIANMSWGDTLILHARHSKDSSIYKSAGSKFRASILSSPPRGFEWLAGLCTKISDEELATAVEIIGRPKRRVLDSSFPILESTPTGDPVEVHPKEQEEYSLLVESVSYPVHVDKVSKEGTTLLDESEKLRRSSVSPLVTMHQLNNDQIGSKDSNTIFRELTIASPSITTREGTREKVIDASLVFNRQLITSNLLDLMIQSYHGIQSIKLDHCFIVSPAIDRYCPHLTELNVSNCTEINDNWIGRIVSIPTLAKLDISHCKKLTQASFKDILTKCSALTHFSANHFGGSSESRLDPQLGFASTQLQSIHLAGFRANAESWCRLIASSNLSSLRKILLDDCLEINDSVLAAFGHCPLTHVSLRGCIHITTYGIESLIKQSSKFNKNVNQVSNQVSSITNSANSSPSQTPNSSQSGNQSMNQSNQSVNQLNQSNQSSPLSVHPLRTSNPIVLTDDLSKSLVSPKSPHSFNHLTKSIQYLDLSECKNLSANVLDVLANHLTHLEAILVNNMCPNSLFGSSNMQIPTELSSSLSSSSHLSLSTSTSSLLCSTELPAKSSPSSSYERVFNAFKKLMENNPNLRRIEMNHTNAGDSQLQAIAEFSSGNLKQLKLIAGNISDVGLHALSKSQVQLELLDLERANITDPGLKELVKACGRNLAALSLSGCYSNLLTEDGLIQVSLNCKKLTYLDLSYSSLATDLSISFITENCPLLQRLCLVDCKLITDKSIELIAKHSHRLQFLNITRCPLIMSIGPLGEGCPDLREIHARSCEYLSDDTDGYDRIANLRSLKFLDLCGCRHITDHTLALLETSACPELQTLVLGRNKIRDVQVQSLRSVRPSLHIVLNSNDKATTTALNGFNRALSAGLSKSGSVLNAAILTSSSTDMIPAPSPPTQHAAHIRKSLGVGNSASVALRALMYDLKMIQDHPVPYVSAQPVDMSEMFVWHGNLLGPEGTPYAGAVFHIELVFPSDYPTNPPSATLFTPLAHPHVHKDRICLDILSDYQGYFAAVDELEKNPTRFSSGWNSSYTVQSILLQMQSFLMDLNENAHGTALSGLMLKIPESIRLAASFSCPKCPHKPGNPWPELKASHSNSGTTVAKSERDMIAEELRCVHTRVPFTEDVLGICVYVAERKKDGTINRLKAFLELLSHTAFQNGVRTGPKSATGLVLLPLWIDESHGKRAMLLAEAAIAELYTSKQGTRFVPQMAIEVLTQLMKSMALDLMEKHMPSIHALQFYFACHRLLIAFTQKYPQLLSHTNAIVSKFSESPEYRCKKYCPDLGTFLALLTISDIPWREVARAYIQESFVRHVFWAIDKYPELATDSPDPDVDATRSDKMFLLTKVSMGICLLQVYFLEHVGRPKDTSLATVAENYDKLYGRLSVKVREEFLDAVKTIQRIQTWDETFRLLGLPSMSSEELTNWHRECVLLSLKAGYHKNTGRSRSKLCHQWIIKGKCSKGNACGYLHDDSAQKEKRSSSSSFSSVSSSVSYAGAVAGSLGAKSSFSINHNLTSPTQPSTPRRGHSRSGSNASSQSNSSGVLSPNGPLDYGEFDFGEWNDPEPPMSYPSTPIPQRTVNRYSTPKRSDSTPQSPAEPSPRQTLRTSYAGRGTGNWSGQSVIEKAKREMSNSAKVYVPSNFVDSDQVTTTDTSEPNLRPSPKLLDPPEASLSASHIQPNINIIPPSDVATNQDDDEGWQTVKPKRKPRSHSNTQGHQNTQHQSAQHQPHSEAPQRNRQEGHGHHQSHQGHHQGHQSQQSHFRGGGTSSSGYGRGYGRGQPPKR